MDRVRRLDTEIGGRLDRAMNARRVELRIRWTEVARRAEMSVQNLSLIRKGTINLTDIAEARIEEALLWTPGSIAAVAAGASPTKKPSRREADPPRDDTEKKLWKLADEAKHPEERVWWHIDEHRRDVSRYQHEADEEARRTRRQDTA